MGSGFSASQRGSANTFVNGRDSPRAPRGPILWPRPRNSRRDHDDETHCRPGGRGRRGRGRPVEAVRRRVRGRAGQDLPGLASRRGVEEEALARAVLRAAQARHRARRIEPARPREAARAPSPAPAAARTSSPRRRSSIPAPAGRASSSRSRARSGHRRTTPSSCAAPRCIARTAAAISATSSRTGRSRRACATA